VALVVVVTSPTGTIGKQNSRPTSKAASLSACE
jgi:hypothetical protein